MRVLEAPAWAIIGFILVATCARSAQRDKISATEVVMQVSEGVRMWCLAAIIILVLVSISMCAMPAHADAIEVIYRGTEVLEDDEPFNVYYIDCKPDSNDNTLVDIKISYVDGVIETRTGEYCNTKLYVNGTLHDGVIVHDDGTHAVEVIAAISSPATPDVIPTETVPPTPAATATIQPTPKSEATSMPTQEPEERETKASVYLPVVMR